MRLFYMSLVRPPGGSRTHKDDVNTCDAVTPVPELLLLGEDRFSLGRSLGVSTPSNDGAPTRPLCSACVSTFDLSVSGSGAAEMDVGSDEEEDDDG